MMSPFSNGFCIAIATVNSGWLRERYCHGFYWSGKLGATFLKYWCEFKLWCQIQRAVCELKLWCNIKVEASCNQFVTS